MPQLLRPPSTYHDSLGSLDIVALTQRYESRELTPREVIGGIYERIRTRGQDGVWITLLSEEDVAAAAEALGDPDDRPLWGIPFAIKDNIDVSGLSTTAACPGFAYDAERTAPLVQRLLDAGAILVGKTNLDQFATGLNGTRSPYGAPRTPFDPRSISGGSSSGSAVAVSAGLVSFAIGTDTAGSGRVPAALTNTVGVKPSRGLVSTSGVVPACRSLDCPSVFSLTVADGAAVLDVVAGFDPADPWSRDLGCIEPWAPREVDTMRLGVPVLDDNLLDEASGYADAWRHLLDGLAEAGAELIPIAVAPFLAAGGLLYSGPWIAERYSGVSDFVIAHPDEIHPVVLDILQRGAAATGADVFRGMDQLRAARRAIEADLARVDAFLFPTVPRTFTVDEVTADPVVTNTHLGTLTTNANLLDLAGVAIPGGATHAGMPFGVTLLGDAGSDGRLHSLAAGIEGMLDLPLGATGASRTTSPSPVPHASDTDDFDLLVVGAHLDGMPLNHRLRELGGTLVEGVRTAACYRLHALPDGLRPGLVRVGPGGTTIEAELYRLPRTSVGELLAEIAAPLAIGTVQLEDGRHVHGFLCEPAGLEGALDITDYGGWRPYRRALLEHS